MNPFIVITAGIIAIGLAGLVLSFAEKQIIHYKESQNKKAV
jgi:hypothetical protein